MGNWKLEIHAYWPHDSFTWFISWDRLESTDVLQSRFILRILFLTFILDYGTI